MNGEPARSIIEKCGGAQEVARITGRDVSRVYRWTYPRERGGSGGIIPHGEATKLLAWARETGASLSAADFFATAPTLPEVAAASGEHAEQ